MALDQHMQTQVEIRANESLLKCLLLLHLKSDQGAAFKAAVLNAIGQTESPIVGGSTPELQAEVTEAVRAHARAVVEDAAK